MANGYYTDQNNNVLGYWCLQAKPVDTATCKWVESIDRPTIYVSSEQAAELLRLQAMQALTKSDTTVIRCYSAGIQIPEEWQIYRNQLRDIATGKDTNSTSLPATPAYPENT